MLEFLHAVWPLHGDAWIGELRSIRGGQVQQNFYDIESELHALEKAAGLMDKDGWDVYYGVLPRVSPDGTAAACAPTTHVLWADIDGKAFDGSKAAALFALGQANLTPSILVDSGNGWHAYWLLRQPYAFSVAQPLMRGLQRAIGSDAVHDAPRVLRLPGTHNHKDCNQVTHDPALVPPGWPKCKPVRLLQFDPTRRYWLSDFDDYAPEDTVRPPVEFTVRERVEYDALPEWLLDLIERGAPQGQRSEAIFKAVMWLHRYGWSRDSIRHVLDREPIGEKLHGMREAEADRWFDRTYDRAVSEPA